MNVCPECYYTGNTGVCPECGGEMIPYLDDADDFEEFRRPRERRVISRHGGTIIRVVTVLVILMLLWFYTGGNIMEAFIPKSGRVYPEDTEFTVKKTIILTSEADGTDMTYDLYLPENNDFQEVLDIEMNPQGHVNYTNTLNIEWEYEDVPNGQSRRIEINYTISTEAKKQKMSSSDSGTIGDIPAQFVDDYIPASKNEQGASATAINGQQWWNDDQGVWTIDPMNPEVQLKATELGEGKVNVYDLVKSVYEWTRNRWSYSTIGGDLKTCQEMLGSESGDCDDQSVVMISVLRAMGIPAWLELGVLYNKPVNSWGGHGWANAVIPKGGSYVIAQIDVVNDEFMFRDPWRFTEYVDDGDGYLLNQYYAVFHIVGGDASFEVKYHTVDYEEDGEIWVDQKSTPFVGAEGLILAVAVVVLVHRRRHRIGNAD